MAKIKALLVIPIRTLRTPAKSSVPCSGLFSNETSKELKSYFRERWRFVNFLNERSNSGVKQTFIIWRKFSAIRTFVMIASFHTPSRF